MPRPEKEAAVAELTDRIKNHEIAIMTQYIGVNVEQVTELRQKLRDSGVVYKVYKNNLAKRALDECGFEDAVEYMEGPTAWAFADDPVTPAKVLKEFGKEVKFVSMNGGILGGSIVTKEKLEALADLPSEEQLQAQLVGTLAMPLRNTVGVLQAVPRNLVNVLDQVRKQKEEGGAEAA